MPRKVKKASFLKKYARLLILALVLVGGYLTWAFFAPEPVTLSVNEVGVGSSEATYGKLPVADGCYYKQVQCIQEPCKPQLICNQPVPSMAPPTAYPSPSTAVKPSPQATCMPYPTCPEGKFCAQYIPDPGTNWCAVRSTTKPVMYVAPSPVASAKPTACKSAIVSIKLSGQCGESSFSSYQYQCSGKEVVTSTEKMCIDAVTLYNKVNTECGSTCRY